MQLTTPEALARRLLGKTAQQRAPSKTVVLLSCTKTKDPRATTARELYGPSASFREGVAYAERRGWPWAVLSAKYGLLLPDDRATNYDETLMGAPTLVRAFWADHVLAALTAHGWTDGSIRLEIHAGKDYTTPLADRLHERGVRVDEPLAGLGTGYRRSFYKKDREAGSRGVVRAGRGSHPTEQALNPRLVGAVWASNQISETSNPKFKGPHVDADDARSILAWLRWNDRDGDFNDEIGEDLDLAKRILVELWPEEEIQWHRENP